MLLELDRRPRERIVAVDERTGSTFLIGVAFVDRDHRSAWVRLTLEGGPHVRFYREEIAPAGLVESVAADDEPRRFDPDRP